MSWPTKYDQCANCGCNPDRRAYGARGHCQTCYYLIKCIERIRAWDRKRPETLSSPATGLPDNLTKNRSLKLLWKEFVQQATRRMGYLRVREEMRSGLRPVEALDVEHKLGTLLHFVRPKAQNDQNASYIAKYFNEKERCVLFGLLDDIEEHMRWQGFSLHDAYERLRKCSPTYPR